MKCLRLMMLLGLVMIVGWPAVAARAQGKAKKKPTARLHYEIDKERMEYLDNGVIRVGADLDLGGAITWLSDAKTRENIINNYDWGRQVQLSFYSGPVPFEPGGRKAHERWTFIGWNPIQVGDVYGHRSKILEFKNDGRELYTRSIPMHWPLDNAPGECTFETWITLEGNAARLRGRINNNRVDDKTQYQARGQELPAVYVNGPYYRLFTYAGDKPFTGDALTTLPTQNGAGFPWHNWYATEHWAALVNDAGWGLGVFNADCTIFAGGFSGKTGTGGSTDAPTGYLTPWHRDIIDHNIQYGFECVLVAGTLEQIRKYAYDHAPRPAPPVYVFDQDRRHWWYHNARDAGWPVRGELDVELTGKDPQLVGPANFWRAEDAPRLFVCAAYQGQSPAQAQVFWKRHNAPGARGGAMGGAHMGGVGFEMKNDGQYHTYEIDLSGSPDYKGAISGLRIDPVFEAHPGDRIKVKWIGFKRVEDRRVGR